MRYLDISVLLINSVRVCLSIHEKPVQSDVCSQRATVAVAGGSPGAEQKEHRGATERERETDPGAGLIMNTITTVVQLFYF